MIPLDWDHVEDPEGLRTTLAAIPTTLAAFVSTSGDGVKVFVAIEGPPADAAQHAVVWAKVAEVYAAAAGLEVDASGKDVTRLCFTSYDPACYIAEHVELFAWTMPVEATSDAAHDGNTPAVPARTAPGAPATEHERDADALRFIPPPDDYNAWLGWLGTLKALSFSVAEVDEWSATGNKHSVGEVEQRWNGLPVDAEVDARNKLRGHAYKLGWGGGPRLRQPIGNGANPAPTSPNTWHSSWYEIGLHYATQWVGRARYVTGDGPPRWWLYDDERHAWRQLTDRDYVFQYDIASRRYSLAQELQDLGKTEEAKLLASPLWRGQQANFSGEFWAAMARTLTGPEPEPMPNTFAAANGVVNLTDGECTPHTPVHGVRSVARGRYLRESAPELRKVLARRFCDVFKEEGVDAFIELCGLALTRQVQTWRGLLWVWGTPGSGKGGVSRLVEVAFGPAAKRVPLKFFEGTASDIDDALADAIEKQPLFLLLDELGPQSRIDEAKLLSRTGDTSQTSRRPHGATISGPVNALVIVTTVDPPSMSSKTGLDRRTAVLKTLLEELPASRKEAGIADDLCDALVTWACLSAQDTLKRITAHTYDPTPGDAVQKQALLQRIDPVGTWLDTLPDDYAGMTLQDLAARATQELSGILDRKLSPADVGRKLDTSRKWRRMRSRVDGKQVRTIQLRTTIEGSTYRTRTLRYLGPRGVIEHDAEEDADGFSQWDFNPDDANGGTIHGVGITLATYRQHNAPFSAIAGWHCPTCKETAKERPTDSYYSHRDRPPGGPPASGPLQAELDALGDALDAEHGKLLPIIAEGWRLIPPLPDEETAEAMHRWAREDHAGWLAALSEVDGGATAAYERALLIENELLVIANLSVAAPDAILSAQHIEAFGGAQVLVRLLVGHYHPVRGQDVPPSYWPPILRELRAKADAALAEATEKARPQLVEWLQGRLVLPMPLQPEGGAT